MLCVVSVFVKIITIIVITKNVVLRTVAGLPRNEMFRISLTSITLTFHIAPQHRLRSQCGRLLYTVSVLGLLSAFLRTQ